MIFYTKPNWFNVRLAINVVVCFVQAQGEFLLLRRCPDNADRHAGRWGMPGGRLEEYELVDACWRELGEETSIWMNKNQLIHSHTLYVCYDDNEEKRDFVFSLFRLDLTRQPPVTINRREHSAYRWVAPNVALGMPLVRDQDEFLRLCCPELTGNVRSDFAKEGAAY